MKNIKEELISKILIKDKGATVLVDMVKNDIYQIEIAKNCDINDAGDAICNFKNIKVLKTFYQKSNFNIIKDSLKELLKEVKNERNT